MRFDRLCNLSSAFEHRVKKFQIAVVQSADARLATRVSSIGIGQFSRRVSGLAYRPRSLPAILCKPALLRETLARVAAVSMKNEDQRCFRRRRRFRRVNQRFAIGVADFHSRERIPLEAACRPSAVCPPRMLSHKPKREAQEISLIMSGDFLQIDSIVG